MKRRHHTPEQIVRQLREADRLLGQGKVFVDVRKHLEVTEATHYRLKRLVAEQALDVDMLK